MKKTILVLMLFSSFTVLASEVQVEAISVGQQLPPDYPVIVQGATAYSGGVQFPGAPGPYNSPAPVLNAYSTDNFSALSANGTKMGVMFTVKNKDPERVGVVEASCDVHYDSKWRYIFQVLGWAEDGPVPVQKVSGTLINQRGALPAMWPGDNVAYLVFDKNNAPIDYVECRADKLTLEEPDMVNRFFKYVANAFRNQYE